MKFHSLLKLPQNSILILPSWNAVNQINIVLDLLIYNAGFKKIGTLESLLTVPLAGADAFGGDDLCSGLEVYLKDNIILLQARSNVIKGKGIAFVQELVDWIKTLDIEKALIITVADSARKPDQAEDWLACVDYRFSGLDGISKIDLSTPSHLAVPIGNTLWPIGGGLTRWLFEKMKKDLIPTGVLMAFCSKGDIKDLATHMANKVNQILKKGILKKVYC